MGDGNRLDERVQPHLRLAPPVLVGVIGCRLDLTHEPLPVTKTLLYQVDRADDRCIHFRSGGSAYSTTHEIANGRPRSIYHRAARSAVETDPVFIACGANH